MTTGGRGLMFYVTACLVFAAAAVFHGATAETYTVGDSLQWTVPTDGASAYETWAAGKSFKVGDTIVFTWNSTHNVAEVSKTNYDNCSKTNTITIQQTSPVNITLSANGTRYFICTVGQHCSLGQKVTINTTGSNSESASSSLTVGAFSAAVVSVMLICFLNMNSI